MGEWRKSDIGQIPSHWDIKSVEDIKCSESKSIISGPFGSNISAKYFVERGVPVIRGNNLSLNIHEKFKDDGFVYITEDKAGELGTWAVKDDVIFTAVGTIGQVGILQGTETYKRYIISNKQLRLRINKHIVDPLYAYYWFASPFMINMIKQRNTGSSVPLINLSVLKSLPIPVPPLAEQKAIAAVLSSLDDKIDLLHRQNKTLEFMAEALFRQWFVEERDEGWEEVELGDIISVKGGTTPSTKQPEYWDGDIAWTSPRDITTLDSIFLFDTERKITVEGLARISSGLLPAGTLLMSSRAPVGVLAFAELPVAINQGYIAIIDDKGYPKEFIYYWLKGNMDYVQSYANGSTFSEISKTAFKSLKISIPSLNAIHEFKGFVEPLLNKMKSNVIQKKELEKLRDTLLPKLVSGEVRVEI